MRYITSAEGLKFKDKEITFQTSGFGGWSSVNNRKRKQAGL